MRLHFELLDYRQRAPTAVARIIPLQRGAGLVRQKRPWVGADNAEAIGSNLSKFVRRF